MNNTEKLWALDTKIMERVPGYEIRFKDESTLMKILGKVLFFNKNFMTGVTTTIGKKVYFSRRDWFESNPGHYLYTLCHEYVHVMDYVRRPASFTIGYLLPQALAILSLGALFAFVSKWFLLFLLALLFLAPVPSPARAKAEIRGYGMSIKSRIWDGHTIPQERLDYYTKHFTGPNYYYMWPFEKNVRKRLQKYIDSDECLSDPIYKDVHDILRNS